ncbi:MAG: hypothetical protein E6H03_05390 [Bacillati bacterium ANGP1]|uniref:ABC-type transport auxiliary lipoprotein component domain-containing protein n=1 Tax=Candidatus Segetimicrobium genomatis TaxID=2569760 RepID=A0A537JGB0_9BACT|nr:MAG: hypothetical protein E6H03_05390 [Terrabacteria group bacterium ANGP1]
MVPPMRWNGVVVILALVAGGTLPGNAGAAPASRSVGVVDFYAPTPLGAFSGLVPERFAADDFSKMLSGASAGRFAVIPRAVMERAETALHWRDADVLRFDRLRALADAAGADRLLVGWISHLVISEGGSGTTTPPDSSGPPMADVSLVVQVFDAAQGRVVTETQHSTHDIGGSRTILVERVLHHALESALLPIASALTAR